MKKFDKRQLGRDPGMGRVSFRTGTVLTRKDKARSRTSKHGKNLLRKQLSDQ